MDEWDVIIEKIKKVDKAGGKSHFITETDDMFKFLSSMDKSRSIQNTIFIFTTNQSLSWFEPRNPSYQLNTLFL